MAGLKHHYVYRSYEPLGRSYIGKRSCFCLPEEDTQYLGSYSDPDFFPTQKEILAICDSSEHALQVEIFFHEFYDVARNPLFANRAKQTSTGFSTEGITPSLETRMKLSKAGKGRVFTPEHKEKISSAHRGREKSPESRIKMSKVKKGRPVSEACRLAQIAATKGKSKSEDHRRKISEANTGRKMGASSRAKMAQKRTENNLGRFWWVNPDGQVMFQHQQPGPEWIKGRKYPKQSL